MNGVKTVIAILLLVATGGALWLGGSLWRQRQWFALVTPRNVWGNVTYAPGYSGISIAEMRALQAELDQILAQTTSANSAESVDRVFELLLRRGRKTRFITGYRDEFRAVCSQVAERTR